MKKCQTCFGEFDYVEHIHFPNVCPVCIRVMDLEKLASSVSGQITTHKLDPDDDDSNIKLREAVKLIFEAARSRREKQAVSVMRGEEPLPISISWTPTI